MFLEVIAKSVDDVIEINKSQANRIELCDSLECGGLTPGRELISSATEISKIPVNVIIRENESWDFIFTPDEKSKMILEIKWISENTKANGVVVGSLINSETIDWEFLEKVNEVRGNLEVTFHKAFDQLANKVENWKKLEEFNVTNVLTSGGTKLDDSFSVLNEIKNARTSTKLLIGGGVTKNNLFECLKYTDQIHIGTAAREKGTWESPIKIENINDFKSVQ
jgi:copper homeostasis protein